MRIDHNIPALQAWMSVKNTQTQMQTTIQRLSTGYRINSAADDAAGYAIVEKMMGQVNGLNTAIQNSQNAISLIQTASGALDQTQSILQRMRELAVEASNDTNTTADRQQIQKEVNQLVSQIDQIRNTTQFNTQVLLNGNLNNVASGGAATLVNPSNTITSAKVSGSAPITTTISVETMISGSGNTANVVEVYVNGQLANVTTGAGTTSSPTVNLSTVTGSGTGTLTISFGTGKEISVTLKNLASGSSASNSTSEALKLVDTGAIRVDEGTDTNNDLIFQVGANQTQTIQLGINDMGAQALGLEDDSGNVTVDVTSKAGAESAITLVDNAIQVVSTEASKLGAIQNRLTHIVNNLQTASTNLTSAQSTIKDVDMAKEMMVFSKQQILLQSSMAMLAQANTNPQQVLRLFR